MVEKPQQQPVVRGAQTSGEQTENHEQRKPRQRRRADRFDEKVRLISKKESHATDRSGRREQCRQHRL